MKEVLDIIAKNDMVLASGHLHVSETWKAFEEAQRRGVKRLVLVSGASRSNSGFWLSKGRIPNERDW
jgi:hypothetical protein